VLAPGIPAAATAAASATSIAVAVVVVVGVVVVAVEFVKASWRVADAAGIAGVAVGASCSGKRVARTAPASAGASRTQCYDLKLGQQMLRHHPASCCGGWSVL
jgi:hypothetical protein